MSSTKKKCTTLNVWGSRGSIPRSEVSMTKYGGSTSCCEYLSYNGTRIVLDMGSGSYSLGHHLVQSFFGAKPEDKHKYQGGSILITHTHWDHIQGYPFFVPLFIPAMKWKVFGPRGAAGSMKQSLAGQMQYDYFPVSLDYLGANIKYSDLNEGVFYLGHDDDDDDENDNAGATNNGLHKENQEGDIPLCKEIKGGDVRVKTHYLNHPCLTLGYRLEDTASNTTVCYITDHEPYDTRMGTEGYKPSPPGKPRTDDDKHVEFMKGADLLLHDSQYTASQYAGKVTWGHSTIEYVVDVALAAGVKRLGLYHHDPMRTDDQVDELVEMAKLRAKEKQGEYESDVPLEVFAAADKMTIEVEGTDEILLPTTKEDLGESAHQKVEDTANSGKILLIYANEADAKPISDHLNNGHDAEVYTDVTKAIKAAKFSRPSLMLVQKSLPGSTNGGIELCRKVREMGDWGRNVPFLVETDSQEILEEIRAEGEEAGVTAWVSKPYSPEYVTTKVRTAMLRCPCRWRKAALPPDEEQRLAMLRSTGILDTDREDRFDRITRISTQLFDVPIAVVSLVDKHRQWFKSVEGLCASETPRDQAFCAHTILQDGVFVVSDALQDDRFADNPLVTGGLARFYAGVPLSVRGRGRQTHNLGTLCLIDKRARQLNEEQIGALKDLGKIVEQELEKSLSIELLKKTGISKTENGGVENSLRNRTA